MTKYKVEKKRAPGWGEIEVLAETYEPGKPADEQTGRWATRLLSRQDRLKFIQESLYRKEGYGSEKRKQPA